MELPSIKVPDKTRDSEEEPGLSIRSINISTAAFVNCSRGC